MSHTITLNNGPLVFSTLSNYSNDEVFATITNRKWSRIILLLHGFPDENHTYHQLWDTLQTRFPHTLLLAPKLRGYEVSSQPDTPAYSLSALAGDVRAWIISLNASKVPLHILGHDWGAVIGYKAASLYPDLISSLVTLAIPFVHGISPVKLVVAAPNQLWLSSYMLRMQFSTFYLLALQQTGSNSYLDKAWKYWSPTWKYTPEDIAGIKSILQDVSVVHSTTAYYRAALNVWNLPQLIVPIDFEKVPTLVVGGEVDGCMSQGLFKAAKDHFKGNKNIQVEIIPGVGHFLQRENPEEVARLAIDWFNDHSVAK